MPENDLSVLLNAMHPQLHSADFVFCSVSEFELEQMRLKPLCLFRENEGVTLVLEKSAADNYSLKYAGYWSLITCTINSDLAAVGFLAAMSTALAAEGIAVNAVSAYFHDHLFVPKEKAVQAMKILQDLSKPQSHC
ncbi:MAG: ACT domain-containing protein [Candidatus Obscuribacterales bacterium]|nr:ACT domain-containing protein [Candidatus Obscuribacterales bacterium]